MRQIIVPQPGGPEVLTLQETSKPVPSAGQIQVRVAYAALNPLDNHARADRIKWQHPGYPFTPGFEYAGLVTDIGEGVDESLLGVRVASNAGWGGNADYAIAQANMVVPVPDLFDWKLATIFSTCAYTSWLLVHTAGRVRPGQTVVIHSAAGAVGALVTQIAKSAGAVVVGLAGGEAKLDYAKQFGADYLMDYTNDTWPKSVLDATDGRGADLIIDGNAGAAALLNLEAVAPMGNIIFMGATAGQAPSFPPSALIGKSCSVSGFIQYFFQTISNGKEKEETHSRLIKGDWRIPVERIYDLEQVAEAHEAWESRSLMGRTLIKVGGDL